MKILRITPVLLSMALLVGCSAHRGAPKPDVSMRAKSQYNHSAAAQLAQAADTISHSLVSLKKIQQAATPPLYVTEPPVASSYGMGDLASVDWSGPVEPLLHKLAAASRYRVRIIGNPPGIPILVTVYAKDKSLGDILRNVGYQCGKKADVVIFPSSHIIEMRYKTA